VPAPVAAVRLSLLATTLSSPEIKEVPGGFVFRIGRNPFDVLRNASKKYGDVCYVGGGRTRLYLVNNPDYIHDILVLDHKNFVKRSPLRFLGNGLITSNGDYHHKQKRLIQPSFHQSRIASYGKIVTEYTQRMTSEWTDGEVLDMQEPTMRLTLQIVAKALFGTDVENAWREVGTAASMIIEWLDRMNGPMAPIVRRLPTSRKYRDAVQSLDKVVYSIIEERRKHPDASSSDLLSTLLNARGEGGEAMSDVQLRDETITLLFAGHETTSTALIWAWYLLAKTPQVVERIQAEVDPLLQGGRPPTFEDLPKLRYTNKVFEECLRLYPSVRLIPRVAVNDYVVGGYRIPTGSMILMSQFLIHRDPRFYKDPEAFDPDRWTPEMEAELPDFAYFPFGGGPRRCVGEPFAWMEATMIIAQVWRNWKMELVPGERYELKPRVGSRPRYGMRLRLRKR
jgi:cytochrome P450